MDWLLFGLFAGLMLAGVPLAVAMGLAGVAVVAAADLGMLSLPTNVYTGIAKYPLMAIPVFVIAGLIFERAGVAATIVRFASALVGQRRGSLAIVAILVAMILGGISGSGPAASSAALPRASSTTGTMAEAARALHWRIHSVSTARLASDSAAATLMTASTHFRVSSNQSLMNWVSMATAEATKVTANTGQSPPARRLNAAQERPIISTTSQRL